MTQPNYTLLNHCHTALPNNHFCLPATVLLIGLEGQPSPTTAKRENPYWHVAEAVTRRRSGYPLPITTVRACLLAEAFNVAALRTTVSAPDLVSLTDWRFLRDASLVTPDEMVKAIIERASIGCTYSRRLNALAVRLRDFTSDMAAVS